MNNSSSNSLIVGGDAFDVAKFILALDILAVHSDILPSSISAIGFIAVPLFFMISSYLFFSKHDFTQVQQERNNIFKKFAIRNYALLLFWTIICFIPTYHIFHWNTLPIPKLIVTIATGLLFKGTFMASWFITSLVITTGLLILLSKKISNKIIFIFSFIFYALVCISTTYYTLNDTTIAIANACNIFVAPTYRIMEAMIWIVIGRYFAHHNINASWIQLAIWAIIGLTLLLIEGNLHPVHDPTLVTDCMFSLWLLCPTLFLIIRKVKIHCSHAKALRNFSVVLYCTHCSLLRYVIPELNPFDTIPHPYITRFIICLALSILIYFVLQRIAKRNKIFRYAM